MYIGFLSKYANKAEKTVDKFFNRITIYTKTDRIQNRLIELMKENLIVVNLWLERKFKNYTFLKKKVRRNLYINAEKIGQEFDNFYQKFDIDASYFKEIFASFNLAYQERFEKEFKCLTAIMAYLYPGKHYKYLDSSNFANLLKNPGDELLQGDCNQIVTLYVYLFSRHCDITNLRIKLPKEHVCLHFAGIDIEATNASWQNYKEYIYIAPITELISVNLLDILDPREETAEIDPKIALKGAQLAYNLSGNRQLVEKNLLVAYHNMALKCEKKGDYKSAIYFAERAKNIDLLKTINYNAAIYFSKLYKFSDAKHFAAKSGSPDLKKAIMAQEAAFYYNNNQVKKARELYRYLGDGEMVKATYQKEYNNIYKTIPTSLRTTADYKKYKSRYYQLLQIARAGGMTEQAGQLEKFLRQI